MKPIPLQKDIATAVPTSTITDATISEIHEATKLLNTKQHDTTEAELHTATSAASKLLRAHAGVIMLRTRAERMIGKLVATGELSPSVLRKHGVTHERAQIAGQLALLPQDQIDTHVLHATASKEPTVRGVRELLPRNTREPHATFTPPGSLPTSISITRNEAEYITDEYHDIIGTARASALTQMRNPRHAYVYMLHEGITEQGTRGDKWSLEQIANAMNCSREYVGRLYYEAKAQVADAEKKALAGLVMELKKQLDAS